MRLLERGPAAWIAASLLAASTLCGTARAEGWLRRSRLDVRVIVDGKWAKPGEQADCATSLRAAGVRVHPGGRVRFHVVRHAKSETLVRVEHGAEGIFGLAEYGDHVSIAAVCRDFAEPVQPRALFARASTSTTVLVPFGGVPTLWGATLRLSLGRAFSGPGGSFIVGGILDFTSAVSAHRLEVHRGGFGLTFGGQLGRVGFFGGLRLSAVALRVASDDDIDRGGSLGVIAGLSVDLLRAGTFPRAGLVLVAAASVDAAGFAEVNIGIAVDP